MSVPFRWGHRWVQTARGWKLASPVKWRRCRGCDDWTLDRERLCDRCFFTGPPSLSSATPADEPGDLSSGVGVAEAHNPKGAVQGYYEGKAK